MKFLIDLVFEPPKNATTLISMLDYFNSLTDVGQGGMFFTIMLIVFGGILFLMMRAWGSEKAFGITSIIISIISVLFRILNWVNDYVVAVCVILGIFGIVLLIKGDET